MECATPHVEPAASQPVDQSFDFDVQPTTAAPVKRKRVASGGASGGVVVGLASLGEAFQWPEELLHTFEREGLLQEYIESKRHTVRLSTSYSGQGCMEQSACMLDEAEALPGLPSKRYRLSALREASADKNWAGSLLPCHW